jgi:catechol 2,3-dioxygenase-like lactoylglutathione lyase family enzyme
MKFGCPVISVKDLNASRAFYEKVLSLKVTLDLGANVAFGDESSVFAIQYDYTGLVGVDNLDVSYKGNDHELYFEEDNFDEFVEKLENRNIDFVHRVVEHSWGQKAVRFYDLDMHIIEVAEPLKIVIKRFLNSGLSIEETAKRMDVPVEYIKSNI